MTCTEYIKIIDDIGGWCLLTIVVYQISRGIRTIITDK
jgi:hypothetical protein